VYLISTESDNIAKHQRLQHCTAGTLATRDAAKDDLERSRQNASIRLLLVALDRIRLAGVGDAVREHEAVLSADEVGHDRMDRVIEELLLRSVRRKHTGEGEALILVRHGAESLRCRRSGK